MASSLSQVLSHFEFRFLLHPYFLLPAFPDLHFYFCFPFSSSDNLFSLLAKGFTSTIILPVFCCLKKKISLSILSTFNTPRDYNFNCTTWPLLGSIKAEGISLECLRFLPELWDNCEEGDGSMVFERDCNRPCTRLASLGKGG